MAEPIVLYHLSDIHFGLQDDRALAWVEDCIRRERPDAICVTGDLTMRARHREYRAANAWIGKLGPPVTVEVGNHDMPYFNLWERFTDPYRRFREIKGLLERERSTLDARAKAVRLSPAGEAALLAARPRVEAADKRIMGLLPKSKRDSFLDLLCSLSDAADAAPEQARAEIKAAKKAAKEAKKAEKAARKGDGRGKKKKKGELIVEQPQADDAADAVAVPLKGAAES